MKDYMEEIWQMQFKSQVRFYRKSRDGDIEEDNLIRREPTVIPKIFLVCMLLTVFPIGFILFLYFFFNTYNTGRCVAYYIVNPSVYYNNEWHTLKYIVRKISKTSDKRIISESSKDAIQALICFLSILIILLIICLIDLDTGLRLMFWHTSSN